MLEQSFDCKTSCGSHQPLILTTKQIDYGHVDTLDKFETIYSRIVLAEVKEKIRNWIDLQTLDPLFNFAIDHMRKNLSWLFGSKDGIGTASLYLCSVYQILVDLVFMFSYSVWMGYVPTHLSLIWLYSLFSL